MTYLSTRDTWYEEKSSFYQYIEILGPTYEQYTTKLVGQVPKLELEGDHVATQRIAGRDNQLFKRQYFSQALPCEFYPPASVCVCVYVW